jgi:uncharacterized protein (TIGR02001 family)
MFCATRTLLPLALLGGLIVGASTAMAAEPAGEAAPSAEGPASDAWVFDAAFGALLTSDYMFRGITQTDHEPAAQVYFEPSYGIVYAGVFASNVDFGTPDPDLEVDLYAGLRPTFGPVSTDLGYVHYFYPSASDIEYGEFKLAASTSPTEMVELGGALYLAPDYGQTGDHAFYAEGNATVSLPHDISVSGAFGVQTFGSGVGLSDYLTWNLGAAYTWKAVTFDLRYHDTDLGSGTCAAEYTSSDSCEARIVATISVDTSWSALQEGQRSSP